MKLFSLIMVLLFAVFSAKAQIDIQGFKPKQLHKNTLANVATETMPTVDVATILAEEEKEKALKGETKGVFVFGKEIDVNLNLGNSGTWFNTPKGRVWKLVIHSPKALSINLAFDKFRLPEGANLLIYNRDSSTVMGPITSIVNNKNNTLGTDLISGDMSILELFEPTSQKGKTQLSIAKVVHGYKDALSEAKQSISNGRTENYNTSASCQRDIACESSWANEGSAVARVVAGGGIFTGALINDVCQTWKPFFLTAYHAVFDIQQNLQSFGVFRFRYRRTQCNNTNEPEPLSNIFTLNGCTLRSLWFDSDFALLELNLSNQGFTIASLNARGIHFLGWTRDNPSNGTFTGIHHPRGDVMKINFGNFSSQNSWSTSISWTSGFTESGSSGSALFDGNRRIVGQLAGVPVSSNPNCQNLGTSIYGRFDQSWNGGGTPSTRLKDWLDPDNINPQYTNTILAGSASTTNPNLPSSSLISVSGQGMTVCSAGLNLGLIYNGVNLSANVSYPLPFGITQIEWAPTSGNVYIVGNQINGGVTATAYANSLSGLPAQLRVRIRNCAGWSEWYVFYVNVCSGFRFIYSPNPTSEVLTITAVPTEENKDFTIATEIDFEAKLLDQDGKVVREGKNQNKENKLSFDVKGLKEGTYYLHILHGKELEKHQIIISKSVSTN
ncbi:T9SS type A sorting domain-containing protein [Thermoflexibacter ruber]|uniref:Por secretion system C-terminal sorting domain-containing protein n=1 Tax=Thermoflexibacter ruber TaxID=1003 RepID=A0A1I2IE30_9BACT|nr:T9SS type A sorting domain-containing protein [Thermoflexibacter ruber]SFF40609.1 Por secretion system C-terminal sorting domain-containing protein [Thermoflexibacter ruber]